MRFELTILGSNSATFAFGRHLTAQLLNIREQLFLIDCGEGTQMQMNALRIKAGRIQHIFISHLHGDHVFGLIGLINTYSLSGRTLPLYLYGAPDLRELIEVQLRITGARALPFELHFIATQAETPALIFENSALTVHTLPLQHRIAAHGFLFREKMGQRRLCRAALEAHGVGLNLYNDIKTGADFLNSAGETIPNALLTYPPARARAYAFCSDTAFLPPLVDLLGDVDLLYHEATFAERHAEQAARTQHSTAMQAAEIARRANVGQLILGHFSSRYDDLTPLLQEAQSIFPRTDLAREGETFGIPFDSVEGDALML